MKIRTLLLTCFGFAMLWTQVSQAQTTVTVGTGTTTARFPFGSTWGYERSASLYTSTEINASGFITQLAWSMVNVSNGAQHPVRIYLATTSNTTLSSVTWSTMITGATLVYESNAKVFTANSWNTIPLTVPFAYNGSSNLLVLVECSVGGSGMGYTMQVNNSTATSRHQTWTADVTPPAGTGTIATTRPNIRLTLVPPPPVELSVNSILSPINLTTCNNASYNLQFRVRHSGTQTITAGSYIRYGYTFNGSSPVIDSVQLSADLSSGSNLDISVNNININGVGTSNARVWVSHNIDTIKANDTTNFTVLNPQCVSSAITWNFENSNGGWTSTGLWQWAALNKSPLNNPPAGSGSRGWITDSSASYIDNLNVSLISPFMDFRTACVPQFTWKMRFQTEAGYDAAILEATTDGINWTKVNTITPAYNNTSGNGPIAPNKFSGSNGSWTTYVADLSAFGTQPLFRLRFRFGSDGSGVDAGFAIDDAQFIYSQTYSGLAFTIPDTAIKDVLYEAEITNSSPTRNGVVFEWLVDGVSVGTSYDLNYRFPNLGNAIEVKVRAKDLCGAVLDSLTKTLVVIAPSNKPSSDFIAQKNTAQVFESIAFTNLSSNDASYYEWYVSPNQVIDPISGIPLPAASFDNGTNANSRNPYISFLGNGAYEVCLIAENALGRDTTCKQAYIIVGGKASSGDSIMCVGTSTDAPSGNVYDSGGPNGDYSDGEFCQFTIEFSCYDSLYLTLNSFAFENNWDYLYIFDGDETGTPLWNLGTFPNGMTGVLATPPVLAPATSGKVTIFIDTDGSNVEDGFSLTYRAASMKMQPTTADFIIPDTICATYPVSFTNTSVNATEFFWDFQNTGTVQSTDKDPTYLYANGGTYPVKMIAVGCMGTDTLIKDVVAVNPGANTVQFGSSSISYTTNDIVLLVDSTDGCSDSYLWEIFPPRASFLNGSDLARVGEVRFDTAGTYDVKLTVYNNAGEDTLRRDAYITVYDICNPAISTPGIPDVGISRVSIGNINNITAGNTGYTDYRNTTTTLEKGRYYPLSIERPSTANMVNRRVWIDFNGNGNFNDPGEEVLADNATRTLSLTGTVYIPRNAHSGQVTMRVTSTYYTAAPDACGNRTFGETEDYRLILLDDVTKPVITLNGRDTVIINRLDTYSESGATANDNLDGNLTPFIVITPNVDSSVAGTYQVSYDVTDTAGNAAITVIRTIIVLPDAPSITLLGLSPDTIDVFSPYLDPGVDGRDFNNDILQYVVSGTLDSSRTGLYTLTYTVTDRNGRSSQTTRDIRVVDRIAPTAQLIGDTVTVEVFGQLVDPGVTPADNYCPVSSISVTAGSVDLNTIGLKTLTYTITDCEGNQSSIDRVVKVVDTEAPEISLRGDISANVIRLRTYTDEGYSLGDNYDPNSNIDVDTLTTLLNTETPGLYTLRYKATDGSGNSSFSETRFIYVLDNVGLQDIVTGKMEVYPNPNRGVFTISSDDFNGETVKLRVVDVTGKEVLAETMSNFNGQSELTLTNAQPGVYMVFLINGNQQAMVKVVVQ